MSNSVRCFTFSKLRSEKLRFYNLLKFIQIDILYYYIYYYICYILLTSFLPFFKISHSKNVTIEIVGLIGIHITEHKILRCFISNGSPHALRTIIKCIDGFIKMDWQLRKQRRVNNLKILTCALTRPITQLTALSDHYQVITTARASLPRLIWSVRNRWQWPGLYSLFFSQSHRCRSW